MANPNLVTVGNIKGQISSGRITGGQINALTCPSNHVLKINSMTFSAEDLTSNSTCSVRVRIRSSSQGTLVTMYDFVDVPSQTTFVAISSDTPLYLTEGIIIQLRKSGDNLNYTINYEDLY